MRVWDWLLRRKPKKEPLSDEEAVRLALEELGRRHEHRQKRKQLRQHHIDDFRELRIDHADPDNLSEDLLYLTKDTYQHRALYGSDEEKRVDLTGKPGAPDGAEEAARASEDAKADMEKKGIKPREHYYRAAERQQTGEIQETFEIEIPQPTEEKEEKQKP